MGQDIQYNNINFPGRAAARAVCLASHNVRGGCGSARTMRVQQEVQLALRNNYYSRTALQILFIYMAAAPSATGGLKIAAGGNTRYLCTAAIPKYGTA